DGELAGLAVDLARATGQADVPVARAEVAAADARARELLAGGALRRRLRRPGRGSWGAGGAWRAGRARRAGIAPARSGWDRELGGRPDVALVVHGLDRQQRAGQHGHLLR